MVHAAARWRAAAPRTAPSALSGRKSCCFTNVLRFQMLFSPFFIHPTPTHSSAPNPHGHHPCPTLRNLPMCPPKPLCSKDVSADSLAHICFSEWEFYKSKVLLTFRTPVPSTRTNLDFPLSVSSQSSTSSSQEVQSPDLVLESLGSPSLLWGGCLYAFGLQGHRP